MAGGIRVLARIRMLSEDEGGRSTPLRGWYRPNHNFGSADDREMDTGLIELPEQLTVLPGDSFETEFVLWDRPGLDRIVVPGRQWRIQRGRQLVAIGTVLSVLD